MIVPSGTDFFEPVPRIDFDGKGMLPAALRGSVLMLGSFDGFHLGHRAVLETARTLARRSGRPLAVLQADPHPLAVFRRAAEFRIVSGAARALLLGQCGFDLVYAPRFDRAFAATLPEDFVTRTLVGALGVSAVVAGIDFRFGRDRAGDVALLSAMGRRLGFAVAVINEVASGRERVSSTRIRAAIREGKLAEAADLLGRPWMTGIYRQHGRWHVEDDQILPPPGTWSVAACDALGVEISRTELLIEPNRTLRVLLPAQTRMLRFFV